MNEKDIIQFFISKQQTDSVAIGIGDDCAVLNPSSNMQLVVTTDSMVEGRHFFAHSPAYHVGYKLMARSLSDIAAMCAQPKWATLNLTLTEINQKWLSEFSAGLLSCARENNVVLVGGDTTIGNQLNLSLQITGEVPKGSVSLRSDSVAGDIIFVTGIIGRASRVLNSLLDNKCSHSSLSEAELASLYMPSSRIQMAIQLRSLIHAAIDISDGLLHELEIICEQSHLGAELNLHAIPIDDNSDVIAAITGGDDYELLFTASSENTRLIQDIANQSECKITAIGLMNNSNSILLQQNGEPVEYPRTSGFDHLSQIQ